MKLVVKQPFAGYKIGDEIEDAAEAQQILESELSSYVTQTADTASMAPNAPAPDGRSSKK